MKGTALIAVFMIISLNAIGTYFSGIVVAKLPFYPSFGLILNLTHRGLLLNDNTDCSYIFIYVLATFFFRTNIQRIFKFEPPKLPFAYPTYGGFGNKWEIMWNIKLLKYFHEWK